MPVKVFLLSNGIKVGGTVLAQGADNVFGQLFTFVDPAADPADITLLVGLGLGLDVLEVVSVGHGIQTAQICALGHIADEHDVGIQIHLVDNRAAQVCVGILGQEGQTVGRPLDILEACQLIGVLAALEAKALEQLEGRIHRQGGNIELTGLGDGAAGVVTLVDVPSVLFCQSE